MGVIKEESCIWIHSGADGLIGLFLLHVVYCFAFGYQQYEGNYKEELMNLETKNEAFCIVAGCYSKLLER